uniref:Uncharacterized protein n=1 Tax=Haematobia irritans TaxID=7368 RepID=A0A1L8EJJ2_HAEIR
MVMVIAMVHIFLLILIFFRIISITHRPHGLWSISTSGWRLCPKMSMPIGYWVIMIIIVWLHVWVFKGLIYLIYFCRLYQEMR